MGRKERNMMTQRKSVRLNDVDKESRGEREACDPGAGSSGSNSYGFAWRKSCSWSFHSRSVALRLWTLVKIRERFQLWLKSVGFGEQLGDRGQERQRRQIQLAA